MTTERAALRHKFLAGGGALGCLISDHDWSETALGAIEHWPAALTAAVSMIVRAKVPMAVLWGPTGVMLYNDGYAEVAGGRHPMLLGTPVLKGWPEAADFNRHVLETVLTGDTLHFRDQPLELERYGTSETAWFTLDYSPIVELDGAIGGVLAIVRETTSTVLAEQWRASEAERLQQMYEQAPGFMATLRGPNHVFELANAAYRQLIGHRDVLNKSVMEALPEVVEQGFIDLLDQVYNTGEPFVGRAVKAVLQRTADAPPEERYVDLIYQPLRGPTGEVEGIFVEGADVTERITAEASVRESARKFAQFAEAMPNHVWSARPDGQLDWFNSRVYQYSGTEPGELDGAKWAGIVHPDDLPAVAAAWTECVANGVPYEAEFRVRRRDGSYRWHLVRSLPIADENGRVERWIGTNTDIENQKKTAQQLLDSDARLQLAIKAGQLAVWELDNSRQVVTATQALNRLFGFADDATPSLDEYNASYAPGDLERISEAGAAAVAAGKTDFEVEAQIMRQDGISKWVLIRAQIIDGGQRIIGVVIDISERRQTEERLMSSERRFRLSQNAAGIGSLELNIATGDVHGSERFWELWGLDQRDSIHISELEGMVLPEDAEIRSSEATRQAGTAVPDVEYRIRRRSDGEVRWVSRNVEFTYDANGKPLFMYGVMQDITEAKEARARQELLTHELEHRIKNILAMVSAIASQTLRNADLETAAANFSERLRALSDAHDILTQTKWTQAGMSDVVQSALRVLPPERIVVRGPNLPLDPKKALSLALAINELGTNALKYGALANDTGQVELHWDVVRTNGEKQLVWVWRETGAPPVSPPTRKGFGRFLIERVLASDFKGKVNVLFHPEGVEVTLTAPVPVRPQEF